MRQTCFLAEGQCSRCYEINAQWSDNPKSYSVNIRASGIWSCILWLSPSVKLIFHGWTVFPYVWIYVEEESHSIVLIRFDSSATLYRRGHRRIDPVHYCGLWGVRRIRSHTHTHTHTVYSMYLRKKSHTLYLSPWFFPFPFSVSFHSSSEWRAESVSLRDNR